MERNASSAFGGGGVVGGAAGGGGSVGSARRATSVLTMTRDSSNRANRYLNWRQQASTGVSVSPFASPFASPLASPFVSLFSRLDQSRGTWEHRRRRDGHWAIEMKRSFLRSALVASA